jgi:Tripartite tricarboxylate transporter family receptor
VKALGAATLFLFSLSFLRQAALSPLGRLNAGRAHRQRRLRGDGRRFCPDSVPGYDFDSWIGLLGPAAMPPAALGEINAAIAKLLQDPAMLERLANQGVEPRAMSPEAFGALLRADFAKMAKLVKASGARID